MLEYERYAWKEEKIQTRINDEIRQSKEEGLAEGEKKAKIETVKNALALGGSIE